MQSRIVETGRPRGGPPCAWSGQRDSNPRPSAPKADALPDCAMPRAGPAGFDCGRGIVAGSQLNATHCGGLRQKLLEK